MSTQNIYAAAAITNAVRMANGEYRIMRFENK